MASLVGQRNRQLAETIRGHLGFKFAAALHHGETDAGRRPRRGDAQLHVRPVWDTADMRAVVKGIAVDEDIARHRAAVDAQPDIPAKCGRGAAETIAWRAQRDSRHRQNVRPTATYTSDQARTVIAQHI